jgi:hypothetical protein
MKHLQICPIILRNLKKYPKYFGNSKKIANMKKNFENMPNKFWNI